MNHIHVASLKPLLNIFFIYTNKENIKSYDKLEKIKNRISVKKKEAKSFKF